MTRARLDRLREALERAGWRVEGESCADGLFDVEGERIARRLSRDDGARERLAFFLFAPLGGPTRRLADLARVDARHSGRSLYSTRSAASSGGGSRRHSCKPSATAAASRCRSGASRDRGAASSRRKRSVAVAARAAPTGSRRDIRKGLAG